MIHGIHHVALKYEGIEKFNKALHFYGDILALPILRRWGEDTSSVAMLDTGSGYLELFANSPGLSHGVINHIAFAVSDVDAMIEKVRSQCYPIIVEPKDQLFPSVPPYAVRIGFCIGPGGEKVEFFKEYENSEKTDFFAKNG